MWLSRKMITIFSGRKNRDKGNSTMRDKRDNMKDKTGFAIWYEKTVAETDTKADSYITYFMFCIEFSDIYGNTDTYEKCETLRFINEV